MTAGQLSLRAAVAAGLSVALAYLLEFDFPIYALIAAVIVTDLSPSQSRQLGLRRIAATIVGAACGAMLSPWLLPGAWSVGLAILLAMVICQLLQMRDGAKIAAFICGIIVLSHNDNSWLFALHRFVETLLGVVVAWAISYTPKLIRIAEADQKA